MKRGFLHLLCVFLLLVAQQGALTHSVWHLRDHLPGHQHQDQAAAAQDHDGDEHTYQSRLCDLHAALGTLLAGDCGGQAATAAATFSQTHAAFAAAWRVAQPAPTPPSRAPPVLL